MEETAERIQLALEAKKLGVTLSPILAAKAGSEHPGSVAVGAYLILAICALGWLWDSLKDSRKALRALELQEGTSMGPSAGNGEQPSGQAKSTDFSEETMAVTLAPQPRQGLVMTDVNALHQSLKDKGPIGRFVQRGKEVGVAEQAKDVIEASTALINAQADQIKTVLTNQNQIDELQDEAALRELKRQKKEAELKAQIAGHKLVEEKSHQARRDLKIKPEVNPPLPQEAAPKRPSRDELVETEVRRRDEALQSFRAMRQKDLIDDEAIRRFEEETQERFEKRVNEIMERGR